MKKNLYLLLIFLGVTAFIIGVFVYNRTEPIERFKTETAVVHDIIHDSKGTVNLTVEYPTEIMPEKDGIITLYATPDAKVTKILDKNLTIDAYLATMRLTTSAERRQVTSLMEKGTKITWAVSSKTVVNGKARVSVGLSDARTDPTLYPIAPQHHFNFDIKVVEQISQPGFAHYLPYILMAIGAALLVYGFVLASKDFDAHIKESRKRK